MQESALQPIFHVDFIKIIATEMSVMLESPKILGLTDKQADFEITAKIDVIIEAIKLDQIHNVTKSVFNFGVSTPIADLAIREKLDPIINSLVLV